MLADAMIEKYIFFLDSFFWLSFTLFNKTFISVLFELLDGLSSSRYFAIMVFFREEVKFFMIYLTIILSINQTKLEREINS